VGGILGLFAGISLLSIVEIIYWIVFKIFNILRSNSSKVRPFANAIENDPVKSNQELKEFLVSSSIHGFFYLVKLNWPKRIFWILSFFLSMAKCVVMIMEVRDKVPNSRTVAFDDQNKFIENVKKFKILEISFQTLITDFFPCNYFCAGLLF
jgi:hypothetical protein